MVKRFTRFRPRLGVVLFTLVLCALSSRAIAQAISLPLAKQIPADAVAYIGWAGADAEMPAYQASNMSALVDHSNLPQLAGEYLPKLWEQLAGQTNDPQAVAALRKALPLLWRHPVAVYASGVSINPDGTPRADVALVCDAGGDATDLSNDLTAVIHGNDHLHVVVRNSLVTLGVEDSGRSAPSASLADAPGFSAVMKSLQPASPAIAVYVDAKALLQKADESAGKDANAADIWPKVRDALGIADLKTFAMTAGFNGSNWMTASLLDAPGPRQGLLAVIEPKPLDAALLARIPASSGAVSISNFDAALMFDTFAKAMAVTPVTDKLFHQITGAATLVLGRNFRREILGPLGPQWVVYSDLASNSLILLNHPTSAHTASDSLVSAAFGLMGLANTEIPGAATQPVVTADQRRVKGVELTTAIISTLSPTFAVQDKILYLGMTPGSVVTAATRPSSAGDQDVLHSAGFTAAAGGLSAPDFISFDYCDIPNTAPAAYANFPAAGAQLRQVLNSFDIILPPIQLPPVGQLQRHLSPLFSASWTDANGIYSRSVSPFPGSGLLLGNPQQLTLGVSTLSAVASLVQLAMPHVRVEHAMNIRGQPWTTTAIPVLIPDTGVAASAATGGR